MRLPASSAPRSSTSIGSRIACWLASSSESCRISASRSFENSSGSASATAAKRSADVLLPVCASSARVSGSTAMRFRAVELQVDDERHALHVVGGPLGEQSRLFHLPDCGIEAGHRIEANQTDQAAGHGRGRLRGCRRHHGHEFPETQEWSRLDVHVLCPPVEQHAAQIGLLRRRSGSRLPVSTPRPRVRDARCASRRPAAGSAMVRSPRRPHGSGSRATPRRARP